MITQIVRDTFQNQEKVDALKDIHDRKFDIKLDHPQRIVKHITPAHGME